MKSKPKTKTKRRNRRLSASDCHALGATLARAAFTSGDGKKACRLVFLLDNGHEYGGWAEGPLARHLEKIIEAQNVLS